MALLQRTLWIDDLKRNCLEGMALLQRTLWIDDLKRNCLEGMALLQRTLWIDDLKRNCLEGMALLQRTLWIDDLKRNCLEGMALLQRTLWIDDLKRNCLEGMALLQRTLWIDDLKRNCLEGMMAQTIVGKIESIDDIWKKLIESFGNTRIFLQNKVSALENIGGLWKASRKEKIALVLATLTDIMSELSDLAKKFELEEEFYYGGCSEKILGLLGNNRKERRSIYHSF